MQYREPCDSMLRFARPRELDQQTERETRMSAALFLLKRDSPRVLTA